MTTLYFDLMVSNERKANVVVRQLNPDAFSSELIKSHLWWSYEVTVGAESLRGTIEWTHDIEEQFAGLAAAVLADYCKQEAHRRLTP